MDLTITEWVVFGVCLIIGVAIVFLFVVSVVFCQRKLKEETNVRKRIVSGSNVDIVAESPESARSRPGLSIPPAPLHWQPMFIPRPRPLMMRPIQPTMTAPPQPRPRPQSRDDDWMIIKKIKRRVKKPRSEGGEINSDSEVRNARTGKNKNTRIIPTRYNGPRPDSYDAAVPSDGLPVFSSSGFYGRPSNMPLSGTEVQPGIRRFMLPRQ